MLVQAFTVTNDWGEFLKIKETLAVKIIEIVENNSAAFAFPSQSIYVEKNFLIVRCKSLKSLFRIKKKSKLT